MCGPGCGALLLHHGTSHLPLPAQQRTCQHSSDSMVHRQHSLTSMTSHCTGCRQQHSCYTTALHLQPVPSVCMPSVLRVGMRPKSHQKSQHTGSSGRQAGGRAVKSVCAQQQGRPPSPPPPPKHTHLRLSSAALRFSSALRSRSAAASRFFASRSCTRGGGGAHKDTCTCGTYTLSALQHADSSLPACFP